jgi:hypothetical protein
VKERWTEKAKDERVARRVWLTSAGDEIPYDKLGDEHLKKILAHLRTAAMHQRGYAVAALVTYRPTPGSMASDAAEDAMTGFLKETDEKNPERHKAWRHYARPELEVLERIARSRKLDLGFLDDEDAAQTTQAELDCISIEMKCKREKTEEGRLRALAAKHGYRLVKIDEAEK